MIPQKMMMIMTVYSMEMMIYDSTESLDTDGDGTGNNADTDDDGDGVI